MTPTRTEPTPSTTDPGAGSEDAPATTRDRLVEAAQAVFGARGYDGARVQDIARAAGLTTGAIYANYRDKSELLLDAIGTGARAEIDRLLEALGDLDPREVLEVLGARVGRPDVPPARPLLLDAVVAARRDPDLAANLRHDLARREALVARVVRDAQAQPTIDPDLDTATVVRFCVTLALGSLVVRSLGLPATDPDEWDDLVVRLLDAIAPDGAAPSPEPGTPSPEPYEE